MILALAITVALLTAALFFHDFFAGWADFLNCLTRPSPKEDDLTSYPNDPEGTEDNGVAKFKIICYFAIVIGSGLLVFACFRQYFGPEF